MNNRASINGHVEALWIISEGTALEDSSVETLFINLSKKIGVHINPHLLRHIFATLWLRNGGNSLMLQRLLGHTTFMMNRYCQAVGCYDAIEAHVKYSPVYGLDK